MGEGNSAVDKHPIQGGVPVLLVSLCWVSRDGLASHPGLRATNASGHFMLGIL